jgi:hypothetical protein
MADITYRANLKSSNFPFLSELFGRSVIVKQQDQNYIGGLASKESLDSAIGIPQLYYLHNVVPTDSGYKSVGYREYSAAAFPSATEMNSALVLRDGSGNSALLATTAVGNLYVMEKGTSTWVVPVGGPAAGDIIGKRVTVAFVSGVTYIYFANVGCYVYDWTTNTLTLTPLSGLVAADVIGLVGHKGYLLAYSVSEFAWSSVLLATDFVPSLETGAGGGQVEGVKGQIVTAEEVYGGVIIFAEENCIAAVASDNPRFPYSFQPITGSGGLNDASYVSRDSGSGAIYAYTTSGMQSISVRQAQPVFPEVTDFLSGGLFEDFDELTNELSLTNTEDTLILKRLVVVADRYLVISYGESSLTHGLYYDTAYKQWGRLKVEHTDCFELGIYPTGTSETPKRTIAFLSNTGQIQTLDTDIVSPNSSGVLILGKYQYVRSRLLQLQGVEFENVNVGDTFSLYDLPSYDGKVFQPAIVGYAVTGLTGKAVAFLFHNTAVNHSLLLKGAFHAVSLLLNFNVAGAR